MKKILAIVVAAVLLTSCNKDKEIDIIYQFTAEITMSDVIKSIKDIDGKEFYRNGAPIWDSEKVALMFNIYDQSGNLISSDESTHANFLSKATINKTLQEGDYTIVAIVYIKEMEEADQYWTFSNKDHLENFKIEDNGGEYGLSQNQFGLIGSCLGVLKQEISIVQSSTFQLNVLPATSMLEINYMDMHLSGVKYVHVMINTANDYYDVNEQNGIVHSMLNRNTIELEKSDNYSNVVAYVNYFPTSSFDIIWEGYNSSGIKIKGGTVPSSALVTTNTKLIKISTQTGAVSTETKAIAGVDENTGMLNKQDLGEYKSASKMK